MEEVTFKFMSQREENTINSFLGKRTYSSDSLLRSNSTDSLTEFHNIQSTQMYNTYVNPNDFSDLNSSEPGVKTYFILFKNLNINFKIDTKG